MKYVIAGSTARTATGLAAIHRNTAVGFFHKLRYSIALKQHEQAACYVLENGAPRETRTPDPLITNQVLYQLSYKGAALQLA